MNKLPKFSGDNGKWVYDRIMVVRCPNVIPKEQQDRRMLDKLYAERDGIVYKAIKAVQTVIHNGYRFSEPECVAQERARYMKENSTVTSFLEECMCPWHAGKTNYEFTTSAIYRVYQAWCRENNNGYSKTFKEFREELAAHFSTTYAEMITRINGSSYFKDYTLTPEAKKQYVWR